MNEGSLAAIKANTRRILCSKGTKVSVRPPHPRLSFALAAIIRGMCVMLMNRFFCCSLFRHFHSLWTWTTMPLPLMFVDYFTLFRKITAFFTHTRAHIHVQSYIDTLANIWDSRTRRVIRDDRCWCCCSPRLCHSSAALQQHFRIHGKGNKTA